MLNSLHHFSQQRTSWFLLLASAATLFITALWFQHVQQLEPCLLCIYIRVAVIGIGLAGFIGLMLPTSVVVRFVGIIAWIASAALGLFDSLTLVDKQSADAPTSLFGNTCDYIPNFPAWLPLHEWLPELFQPRGQCSDKAWEWVGVTMAQWMVIAFTCYLVAAALVVISQLAPHRNRS